MTTILAAQQEPMNIAVIGLSHDHVHWIFGSEKRGEFKIAGIVASDKALAVRFSEQYGFPMERIYDSMEKLHANEQFEAVTAFGNIFDHLSVVEFFAPKGIHIMVEKPLAVSLEHAEKMAALAEKYQIHLLTNYETTWYPSNHKAYELLRQDAIGEMRKVIVRDGHKGPKKIGVSNEFLSWLTDPLLNGGGAITDFGCYGANLATWLMDGELPNTVTTVTQQLQAANNPKVDDEAIIILTYDESVAIIQASWNWTIGRKDMEIYGLKGIVYADNRHDLRIRMAEGYDEFEETKLTLEEHIAPYDDPFAYFVAVIRGEIETRATDLSGLENNLSVMKILDAAIRSAAEGQTVELKE
ncbi:MAG: Gfo/Idh/MocA family oxidoreductase [Bacteroidota bacterium]